MFLIIGIIPLLITVAVVGFLLLLLLVVWFVVPLHEKKVQRDYAKIGPLQGFAILETTGNSIAGIVTFTQFNPFFSKPLTLQMVNALCVKRPNLLASLGLSLGSPC